MKHLRNTIKEEAPEAVEAIKWGMPTFVYYGNLGHFAGNKQHMGFYPGGSGIAKFKTRLTGYQTSKGAVRFPCDEQLPLELIRQIVRFRVEENREQEQERIRRKENRQETKT